MTTLDTLIGSNTGFGNVIKTIQSGGAYIDPKGRVLSTTELKPLPTYYGGGAVFTVRDQAYSYDEYGNMIPVPREPLEIYKFDVAGDGKFKVPKLRNEKEGGYFSDITLNATKSGNGYTVENTEKSATGQYFQPLKGTDFSNQQWVGMSRGLANINSAVQSGEATVDTKQSTERWDDGMGNAGEKQYYALRDGNGREVGALYDVPGRADIKYADVGNETAGGGHYVFLQTDPKTGRVAPIQDFGAQVTYRESQGKKFWDVQNKLVRDFAPYAAMIFGGPLAGELGGGLLGAAGSAAVFQAAAGVPIEKMAENIATSTLTAGALGASGVDLAGATGGGVTGTMAANTAANLLQGKTVDQALTNAAISTAISTGADTIAQNKAEDYIENLSIPDYLQAGPTTTSADVMATFPETNPANFVGPPTDIDTTLLDLTTPSNFVGPPTTIDTTLLDLSTAAPTTQTYTYEDGSTLTVDETGGVVGYTDATETPYKGVVDTPDSPLTKAQIEGMIKLGLTVAGASAAANAVQDAISSGGDTTTQTGFPFTPSDISGWARPEYTQTFQGPIDLNSLFTTDNLLGGTQWAGLQGNQFANIPQVSMSDFISSIQNGKV